jgi:prepilin-type N-terminal cleavage/methylation domain-containing protein
VCGRLRSDYDGFTMLEVVVSMVIFGVVALIVAGLITNTLRLTSNNTERTTAANLTAAQIEAVRDTRTLDIPDGQTVLPAKTVGNTTYTLTQTASYVVGGSSTSVCSGSGDTLSYKLVTVMATWPNMGSIKPVRSDTLRSLGIGSDALNPSFGTLAVLVQGATGDPQAGVAVTLSPGGTVRTTGLDGCALFVSLNPATTYTVTVSKFGYVGIDGAQVVTVANTGIQSAKVTRASVNYQQAGALQVALQAPAGFTPPANLALTLSNNLFNPIHTRPFPDCAGVATSPQNCVSGTPRTASALYPGQYGAWAGTCVDAAPTSPNLTNVPAGQSAAATAVLGGVPIQVRTAATGGTAVTTKSVYAVHLKDASGGCPLGETYLLSTGQSDLNAALPPGLWRISVSNVNPPTTGTTVAVPAAGTVTAPVVVVTAP